jgi:hypothetical protein
MVLFLVVGGCTLALALERVLRLEKHTTISAGNRRQPCSWSDAYGQRTDKGYCEEFQTYGQSAVHYRPGSLGGNHVNRQATGLGPNLRRRGPRWARPFY